MRLRVQGPTRDQVREAVACPKCGAVVDEECFDTPTASRDANHLQRVEAAIIALDWQWVEPVAVPEPEPSIDDFRRRPWS